VLKIKEIFINQKGGDYNMKQNSFCRIMALSFVMMLSAGLAYGQSAHVLNNFNTNVEGWSGTGMNSSSVSGGFLVWTDTDGGYAYDPWTNATSAPFSPGAGGVDLTGLDSIEFADVAYIGTDATIAVQLYSQMGASSFWYTGGLSDKIFVSGVTQTVSLPLAGALPDQVVRARTIGLNIRAHTNSATWYLGEVRSTGTGLTSRTYANFTSTSPDSGLQGAICNGDLAAIQGNDGGQNQTGLSQNPAVGDGVLQWVDIPGGNGGAVHICNGFASSSNGRPTDLSNYNTLSWTLIVSASPTNPSATVAAQFYCQTGTWTYQSFPNITLTADGSPHRIDLDLSQLAVIDFLYSIGINLAEHTDTLVMQIDKIEATQAAAVKDWSLF
jgi:hypothetical protein